jgi:hypothetical protein
MTVASNVALSNESEKDHYHQSSNFSQFNLFNLEGRKLG